MVKRYWIYIPAAFFLLLLLSGCSFISDPVLMMKTPELPAEKESLRSIVMANLPEDASLIRSNEENDTNVIHFVDLDNDGVNEAVVFYETPDQTIGIHGMIFRKTTGTWVKQITFDGAGKVLESLYFKDMTNDGRVDIVAGYSIGNEETQNYVFIYSYTGKTVERVLEHPYTNFVISDMNKDHVNDLTIVELKHGESNFITTFQYEDGSFLELDKLEMKPYIYDYYNVVAGKVYVDPEGNSVEGIVLDATLSNVGEASFTTVIVMEDGKLKSVLPNQDQTYRNYRVYSEDINNDGIIEIPLLNPPIGWSYFKNQDEIPYFCSYYQWDGKSGLKFVAEKYHDFKYDFDFGFFPPEWHNKITVDTKSEMNKYLRFVMIDSGKTVAEIKFFSLYEWDKQHDDWKYLKRTSEKVIAYKKSVDFDLSNNPNKNKPKNEVPPIERKDKQSE
ncbi:VCBS repeat-containing protein [Paenibacillus sp. KQZ6P-2]|uniref:VCBS repeat-containing protein n=1 Tax=Paenibacillus mangrovi TaxID=2931978 RepID=A0A9X1WRY3_9BACL|nr:VCBS repeat-containing protein [Paenibacillus mangrovi]MCJ8012508.1 VCBS repeat-containing protein [Paenibacillus mangrovi]